MKLALEQTLELGEALTGWEAAGAPLLTDLIKRNGAGADFHSRQPLGPISWFDVPALFDPSRRDQLESLCRQVDILQLHDDVWRRSGLPQRLGPPRGSFLDSLFETYKIDVWFADNMHFDEVNRWIQHVYECVGWRQAADTTPRSTQKVP